MNLLAHRTGRAALFAALYFCEGGPIGLIWWALPTLLRVEGIAVERITALTATLVLPWTLKFLWAPLVDTWRSPRWGFRAWIVTAQIGMGLSILPLIWLDPVSQFDWWRGLLVLHAFMAATQDVAIDALAINVVPDSERGNLNGSMQAGMLLGRSLFGGGAVLAATWFGREWILGALVASIWSTLTVLLFVHEPDHLIDAKRSFSEFTRRVLAAARRRATWLGLGFALTGAAAFESAGQLAGPFLVDRGVSPRAIGAFFGIAAVAATVIGGLVGGRVSDRWGRVRSVAAFLLGFVTMIALLAVLDLANSAVPNVAFVALLTGMYFFIGLFTAASYALFMDLTDPRMGGTQFSTFMAATNGCESWSGWTGGQLAGRANYGASFLVMCVVSLFSLPLLRRLARSLSASSRSRSLSDRDPRGEPPDQGGNFHESPV